MKYIVCHNNPQGLVISQATRERIFSTGNVWAVVESSLFSLQKECITPHRLHPEMPFAIVLCGMEDRYGVATEVQASEVIVTRSVSDIFQTCEGQRLIQLSENEYRWMKP